MDGLLLDEKHYNCAPGLHVVHHQPPEPLVKLASNNMQEGHRQGLDHLGHHSTLAPRGLRLSHPSPSPQQ
eukprot:3164270-Lingulodinium_polyedra.AAC.1